MNRWKIWRTLVLNPRESRPTCSTTRGEYRSFLPSLKSTKRITEVFTAFFKFYSLELERQYREETRRIEEQR